LEVIMAEGQWVNIPGKGRRWQQPSGTLMMTKPGFGQGEFFQTRASQLLGGAANLLGSMGLGLPGGAQAAGPFGPRGIFGQRPTAASQSRPPMPNLPKDYKRTELAAGAAAEAFRPGAGFPGQQAAGDRAYQQEFSRVAQLTAQDPELQRYEAARKLAVAPGATPEQVQSAEDVGMQIWAQKYGKTLAPKVKPGQAGYDVIQRTLYPGGTSAPALPAESEAMLNAIAPVNEFGVRPNVTPMPGQLPSFGSATEAMFNEVTGGGSLVTPMPQTAQTPQTQAQDLAEAYKQAMLARVLSNK
jgi:hypothetical protein